MKGIPMVGKVVMYVLIAMCVLFYLLCSTEANPMADGSWIDTTLTWGIGVLFLGVLLALVAEILNAVSDTKSLLTSGIVIAGAAVLIFFFWTLSDGTPLNLIGYDGDQNTEGWLRISDTAIFTCYFALTGAVLSCIASEIIQLFR